MRRWLAWVRLNLRKIIDGTQILGDSRFLLSAAREAAPYTNVRHVIPPMWRFFLFIGG